MLKDWKTLFVLVCFVLSACAPNTEAAPAAQDTVATEAPVQPTPETDEAAPLGPVKTDVVIEGVVCRDTNKSTHCEEGEGVAGLTVKMFYLIGGNTSPVYTVVTGDTGYYSYTITGDFSPEQFDGFFINIERMPEACKGDVDMILQVDGNVVHYTYNMAYTTECIPSKLG